jgi:hypothetical protein
VGLACQKGTGRRSDAPVCLWIPSLTGLGGAVEQNEFMCMWGGGYPAWQALEAQPCSVNIVRCCAGFGGMASRDRAGLGSASQQDGAPAGLCRRVGQRRGLGDIVNVCGSLALRACPTEILRV